MNIQDYRRRILRGTLRGMFRGTDARVRRSTQLPAADIRRIVICRPNHRLGNLVMLTPLLSELQRTLPAATVDIVLAGEQGVELFRTFSNVGHIHVLSRRMVRHPVATIGVVMRIRRARYDLAIDPSGASQSGRLLIAATHAPYLLGIPRRPSADAASETTGKDAPEHMAQWPVFLLRRALPDDPAIDGYPALTIQLTPAERDKARKVLHAVTRSADASSAGSVIGVFAEATGGKRYDEHWWTGFIAAIRARHPDHAIVEIAPPDGHSRLSSRFPVFSSPDAREVAAVISNMTCFVSADCGVMHLACASGTPTIGLFCASKMARYAPYGPGNFAIDTNDRNPDEVAGIAGGFVEAICATDAGSHASSAGSPLVATARSVAQ